MSSRVQHILTILAVKNLPKSISFYTEVFGWEQIVNVPVYAEFKIPGGMRLGLYERKSFALNVGKIPICTATNELTPTELYFYVDDIEAAIGKFKKAKARVLSELSRRDWGDEAIYFADLDGNVIVLARPP